MHWLCARYKLFFTITITFCDYEWTMVCSNQIKSVVVCRDLLALVHGGHVRSWPQSWPECSRSSKINSMWRVCYHWLRSSLCDISLSVVAVHRYHSADHVLICSTLSTVLSVCVCSCAVHHRLVTTKHRTGPITSPHCSRWPWPDVTFSWICSTKIISYYEW